MGYLWRDDGAVEIWSPRVTKKSRRLLLGTTDRLSLHFASEFTALSGLPPRYGKRAGYPAGVIIHIRSFEGSSECREEAFCSISWPYQKSKDKTPVPVIPLTYLLPLRLTVPLFLLETGTLRSPNPGSTSILTPCPPESSLLLPLLAGRAPETISASLSLLSNAASTL